MLGCGVSPLAISSGAGAGAQNAIGISVIGGVLAGTILGVLMVPVFYVVIARKDPKRERPAPGDPLPVATAEGAHA